MTKKKTSILVIVIVAGTVGLLINNISISNVANAQEGTIPEWIQNIALFWGEGQISESEFVNALEFLGDEGILKLPAAESAEAQEITRSLEILEERIETIENSPTGATSDSTEGSQYQYVFAMCPHDNIRHFNKIHFTYKYNMVNIDNPDLNYPDRPEYVWNMQDTKHLVTHPYSIKAELVAGLNELGYRHQTVPDPDFASYLQLKADDIEILDVEYSVICANAPGLADSQKTLGYK